MPIVIDNHIVSLLNGPISVTILEQVVKHPDLNTNLLMMFGDEHSPKGFYQCYNTPNCTELQIEFVNILNAFAERNRVDFYFENMKPAFVKLSDRRFFDIYKNAHIQEQGLYYDVRNAHRDLDEYNGRKHTIQFFTEKLNAKDGIYQRYNDNRSNMKEMIHMYSSCFDIPFKNELCRATNIKWHYGDARRFHKRNENKTGSEYISYVVNWFTYFLETYDGKYDLEGLKGSVEGEKIDYIEFLYTIFYIFTDIPRFVVMIFRSSSLFQKQYDKMSEYAKSIFTIDSFIQYAEYLLTTVPSFDTTDIIQLIKLLIAHEESTNPHEQQEMLEQINRIRIQEDDFQKIQFTIGCLGNLPMDMYYVLRTNKQDTGRKNNKLVCNYYGSFHNECLAHYFTNIVRTHRIIFNKEKEGEKRRISIPDNIVININKLMNDKHKHKASTKNRIKSHKRNNRQRKKERAARRNNVTVKSLGGRQ